MMDRRELRIRFFDLDLLGVVSELRTSLWGASDPLSEDEETRYVEFLRSRLAAWEPSTTGRLERYDDAVRELCAAALAEYDLAVKERSETRRYL